MKYDPAHDEQPVSCPRCSWSGTLGQTDDQDVFSADWEHLGLMCVCPKCGEPVSLLAAPQAPAACATLLPAQPEKKGSFFYRGGATVGG